MEPSMWSKLPSDLMQLVFERLSFADFQRAKSVCSSWHYASKQSSPNNQNPWLILFPEKGKDYCLLFNPKEKEDKLYRIQNLGVNFANSNCLATYGSCPLMQDDHQYNIIYILNIFTCEKIDLNLTLRRLKMICFLIKNENLVVRVTGEVLRVKSIVSYNSDVWYFRIYKLDSSNSEWEKFDSLGEQEAIILDLGITVHANTIQEIDGNSIYFSGNHNNYCDSVLDHFWSEKDILIFNLGTQEIKRPHPSIFSSIQLSNAQWSVPNFKQM
ncbi:unnamed protein product [Brassica napus]|uniref:F-box domain-containing protein n=2 Tax=Brassica TaxID=3705 RepID=A0A0D3B0T3_BRAOL|nr:unnamed protein product [Brassica napus]